MSITTTETTTTTIDTPVAATAPEIKFRDDLIQERDRIKPHFVVNKEAGSLVLPASAVFENAPEGITAESYMAHKRHLDLFTNAATAAGLELAVDMFAENKELQTVTSSAPIAGKDTYEAVFKRHGTGRNPKTREVSNYVGAVAVSRMNVISTRTDAEWKAIKANLRSLAEAADL